ncbi:MAG: hypothetical protein K0S14_3349 [Thermomicrobiales bacterium]|jgi:hypothetical protein|nr:hypothetical protein [Thermomicrobiales bacterium]MCD6057932.1 hypothetical protein [Thermomicrobiales bacterium]MDF2760437.1 hypothetical protein [Thermomicrobiales bacterium]
MKSILTPFPRYEITGARLMASAWAAYYAALWRGDPAASGFAEWLAGFWESSLARPDGTPDAQSALAASGRGIDWFERDDWVYGLIPGFSGGYLLPRVAILEHLWPRSVAPAA